MSFICISQEETRDSLFIWIAVLQLSGRICAHMRCRCAIVPLGKGKQKEKKDAGIHHHGM